MSGLIPIREKIALADKVITALTALLVELRQSRENLRPFGVSLMAVGQEYLEFQRDIREVKDAINELSAERDRLVALGEGRARADAVFETEGRERANALTGEELLEELSSPPTTPAVTVES